MLDDITLDALKAIMASDRRPWPRLLAQGHEVAELHFPRKLHNSARELADEVRALGFEVELIERGELRESVTSAGLDVLVFVVKGAVALGGVLVGAHAVAKAANELPGHLRDLRQKLKPYISRAAKLSPELQLDPVHRWLDERYGTRSWSYNPDAIEAKQFGHVMVFSFVEERSGTMHLLAVDGDDVTEIPVNWLPEKTGG